MSSTINEYTERMEVQVHNLESLRNALWEVASNYQGSDRSALFTDRLAATLEFLANAMQTALAAPEVKYPDEMIDQLTADIERNFAPTRREAVNHE